MALPETHPARQEAAAAAALVAAAKTPTKALAGPLVAPDRAETLHELARRIESVVGELTGTRQTMWSNDVQETAGEPSPETPGQAIPPTDYTLRFSLDAALALRELTEEGTDGPLTPEVATAARQAIQDAAAAYARWAVPNGYTWQKEKAAEAVAPKFMHLQYGTSNALAEIDGDEIIDRIVPPELAEQLRAAEQPLKDTHYAPAALAFANAVDAVTGTEFPNETLRRMNGQGRAGIARAAAHRLVSGTDIPQADRPAAVRMIGRTIDQLFDGQPGVAVSDPAAYGQEVARRTLSMVKSYEENPGSAQRDAAEAEISAKFGSGDTAMTPYQPQAPSNSPEASQADSSGQAKTRGIGGRG
jgi:hypothetical protein